MSDGMDLSPGRIDHVGFVVRDLDAAMEHFAATLGHRWSPPQEWTVTGRGPGGPVSARVRLSWSLDGPVHTELIEGPEGSIWSAEAPGALHHVAHCVDDVDAASARLESLGFPLEVAGEGTAGGSTAFAYHVSPHGLRLELMPTTQCTAIARWLEKLRARADDHADDHADDPADEGGTRR